MKLVIIDNDSVLVERFKDILMYDEDLEIVATASNGKMGVEKIEAFKPDIVLLDIVLPELDGFEVIKSVDDKKLLTRPKYIFITSLVTETFIAKSIHMGATFFLAKPICWDTIVDRIKEYGGVIEKKTPSIVDERMVQQSITRAMNSLDEKLSNMFIVLGIPPHIKGYQYLKEAIKDVVYDHNLINAITKQLYPLIAAKLNTSPSKVERAIRHAIEVSWNRGKMENINKIFGMKVFAANEKPTNGEFIALIADKLINDGAKNNL